ncbi:MAG: Cys-tRNA(Pro)/Cys-tRNA(Cys) deacylase [Candidatus Azotimanducaceae bacterium]|jgi:Cys-tRNA(Pro)/Cys-tRNA(Cys) deacylase
MTPAVSDLDKAGLPFLIHEYDHDPGNTRYGDEAAEKMGISASRIFKTLVIELDSGKLAAAILPVNMSLNLKAAARSLKAKKAQMAKPEQVERSSGYVLGGVSPIGQKKAIQTVIDISAQEFTTIFVSGGKRGLEIELEPQHLCQITHAHYESLGVSK